MEREDKRETGTAPEAKRAMDADPETRKTIIRESFEKLVKKNGKALERLSKS